MSYVLPSRKAFSDFVTRIFKNYRDSTEKDDKDVDLCLQRNSNGTCL
jgi:hypothetical protein